MADTPKNKADFLIKSYGKEIAFSIAVHVSDELSDLPRIPYNERRDQFWIDVKKELNKTK